MFRTLFLLCLVGTLYAASMDRNLIGPGAAQAIVGYTKDAPRLKRAFNLDGLLRNPMSLMNTGLKFAKTFLG